jgi:hypothetical protein
VQWDDLRRWRRRTRYHLRVRRWPLHRKIAVGAWIPVLVVGLALFTGPNRTGSASNAAAPVTTTTELRLQPETVPTTPLPLAHYEQEEIIGAWIRAVPSRKTLPQQRGVQRWRAVRDRTILALHKATNRAHAELVHQNDQYILRNQ